MLHNNSQKQIDTLSSKLSQDYWRACFEINFSDRQEGLTVSSIICDR